MAFTLDRNFFTQVGLDSGSLTILGVIVHSFGEPGQYRGVVLSGEQAEATFYVSVERECAVAQVNIDLAELAGSAPAGTTQAKSSDSDCGCGGQAAAAGDAAGHYTVHPKGYAVFRVSGGAGGYAVNVRKAVEDPELQPYDSRKLQPGDIFSAILMRPGRYSIRNALSKAKAEVTVSYPGGGSRKTPYRPPAPETVELGKKIEPARIALKPLQGLNFNVNAEARIVIELEQADDGPNAGG
jgi:hypothetical protein